MDLVVGREGHRGQVEWKGLQIDRFPIPLMEQASFGGIASGSIRWERPAQRFDGEAVIEMQEGRIKNAQLAGLSLPLLDLGEVGGQMAWKGEKIDLKEISIAGRDLTARLTGSVQVQNPFTRSNVACRLEIGLAEALLSRYPMIRPLLGHGPGKPEPLVMTISGTLETPQISLNR